VIETSEGKGQEEADTRIILQSMFVNQQMVKKNSNGRIVIKSSDNDVLLLSLYYSKMTSIDELWLVFCCILFKNFINCLLANIKKG
jgi:hypothetical protein